MTGTHTGDPEGSGAVGTVDRSHLLLVGDGPGPGMAIARRFALGGCRDTLVARIRANSISPGLIESNATRAQLADPERAREMLGKTLVGRLDKPEEGATVALFLASDESSYVMGIDVVLDGGMNVW
jgi:hypothetical protein